MDKCRIVKKIILRNSASCHLERGIAIVVDTKK